MITTFFKCLIYSNELDDDNNIAFRMSNNVCLKYLKNLNNDNNKTFCLVFHLPVNISKMTDYI